MLDKLSSRERILVTVVLGLVPLTIVFALFMWINGQLSRKDAELSNLQQQFADARQKQLQAIQAGKRKAVYVQESLPANINDSKVQYWTWISDVAQNKVGVNDFVLRQVGSVLERKHGGMDVVYKQMTFSMNFTSTLNQLSDFLYRFHDAKLMHRISNISVNPDEKLAPGTTNTLLRLNTLKVRMTIEVISLAEAAEAREFEEQTKGRFARTMEEFEETITYRNIFGLPNNAPKFSAVGSKSTDIGKGSSFNIRATDADDDDELTFELLSTTVAGAKITQANSDDRFVKFEFPAMDEIGSHRFTVRVTDDGCPPRSEELNFAMRVEKPQETITNTEPEPKFKNAPEAYITTFVSDRDGEREVWINARTMGKLFRLNVGDTFELDDHQWTVIKIDAPLVVIQRDNEQLTFEKGSNLATPLKDLAVGQNTTSSNRPAGSR